MTEAPTNASAADSVSAGDGAGRDRWSLVAVAGMLSFVAMLDMNIVTVAVPDIARGLGTTVEVAQWTALGYQLPVVALLLPAGRRLDRGSPRSSLLTCLVGFAAASACAAAAPWAAALIAARVVQGAFAAGLFVLMPVLAARAVRPERRTRAMSVPATLGPLGAVTGPAVGGLLLDHVGWRAVFLVKLPVCLVAAVLAYRALPRRERGPARAWDAAEAVAVLPGVVAVGAVLLALTLAPGSPAWLLLGLAAVPAAWLWLRGQDGRTVTGLLRQARTGGAHLAVLLLAAAFTAARYLIALDLQGSAAYSATTTGLVLLCLALGMAAAGPLGGRLADAFGPTRIGALGAGLTALGFALLAAPGADTSPSATAWRLALAGIGMGLYGGPTQTVVMSAVPPPRMATAGSAVQLARGLGFALGPAVGTAAWTLGAANGVGSAGGLAFAVAASALACVLLARCRPAPTEETPREEA